MNGSSAFIVVLASVFGLGIAVTVVVLLLSRRGGWRVLWASICPCFKAASSTTTEIPIQECYDSPRRGVGRWSPPRRRSVDLGDLEIGKRYSYELTRAGSFKREVIPQSYGRFTRRGSLGPVEVGKRPTLPRVANSARSSAAGDDDAKSGVTEVYLDPTAKRTSSEAGSGHLAVTTDRRILPNLFCVDAMDGEGNARLSVRGDSIQQGYLRLVKEGRWPRQKRDKRPVSLALSRDGVQEMWGRFLRGLVVYRIGLVYTPEEEAQHFERFEEDLRSQPNSISMEAAAAELYDETRPAIMKSFVNEINSMQTTWTASAEQGRFKGMAFRDIKRLCGSSFLNRTENLKEKVYPPEELRNLPASFDARDGFKDCAEVIGHVRDQSDCGSCWAFATTEAYNDRLCIKTGGKFTKLLSPGHMASCCSIFHGCLSFGCSGGFPVSAWHWLHTHGIVTGGDFTPPAKMVKSDGCWPYEFPGCAGYQSTSCSTSCRNSKYSTTFDKDRHYVKERYPHWFLKTSSVKKEIMTNGPVSAAYIVYEDFMSYKSGVYKHTKGSIVGLHAVKIIDWGEENGEEYWLVVNSWNEDWGDHGLFKIALG
ncbi:hypothetical protein FOZ63_025798, partial [Perkinsus olseni]